MIILKTLCVRCMCGEQWWVGNTKEIKCTCGATLKQEPKGYMFAEVPDDYPLDKMPFKQPGFWEEETEIDEETIETDNSLQTGNSQR